jgi:hypothetical protein
MVLTFEKNSNFRELFGPKSQTSSINSEANIINISTFAKNLEISETSF